MLKYRYPTLAWILDYWPITVFAPTILVLIATLALITRWWDRRDQAAQEALRPAAPDADVVVSWQTGRRKPPTAGVRELDRSFGDGPDARAAS